MNGQQIPLFVNKLFSDQSELSYAYAELPFVCAPTGRRHGQGFIGGSSVDLNLGEVLRGDRITVSDYELEMGRDEEARYLCSRQVDADGIRRAQDLIRQNYLAEWIVDNLPGATSFMSTDKSRKYYAAGFKIGYQDFDPATGDSRYFINNHVTIVIRYHNRPIGKGKKVIVGFEIYPKSIEAMNRDKDGIPEDLAHSEHGMLLALGQNATTKAQDQDKATPKLTVPYTYSVYYREDGMIWDNRWDPYFVNQEDSHRIHWLGIINSLIIAGFMTIVVAVILTRTIYGDISRFRDASAEDGKRVFKLRVSSQPMVVEEKSSGLLDQPDAKAQDSPALDDDMTMEDVTGWKQLHSDVFRPPRYGTVLAPLLGSGLQLLLASLGLLCLSAVGVLNPSYRGGFVTVGMALFVIAGVFSGYCSARAYKTFGGLDWKKNCIITATLFPGLMFSTIFVLNLFVWAQASSTALPLGTLISLVLLWLLVQVPLVYAGSVYGYVKTGAWQHPIKASTIPRQVPQHVTRTRSLQTILLAGLVPFAVIFVELLFLFKSLWQDKSGYYYMFGFLTVVSIIWVAVIMEVTVVAVYFQLCAEVRPPTSRALPRVETLTQSRIIIGGGSRSLSAVARPSGCLPTRHTSSVRDCMCTGSCRHCSSLPTPCWPVRCMGFSRVQSVS